MPYPQAMRERAIAAYLEQGMKKIEVCRIFGIQRRSFDEWLRVYEKEGRTCAKAKYQKGHSHHVEDIEAFREFIQETPFNTVYDLLAPFEQRFGRKIRYEALRRWLHRVGFIAILSKFYTIINFPGA